MGICVNFDNKISHIIISECQNVSHPDDIPRIDHYKGCEFCTQTLSGFAGNYEKNDNKHHN